MNSYFTFITCCFIPDAIGEPILSQFVSNSFLSIETHLKVVSRGTLKFANSICSYDKDISLQLKGGEAYELNTSSR